ncbi:hypothetical protein LCGC14_0408930 [marine sediment metagenome]|uniref:Uncharacterized protein n=1 Tax=marine sediment metagenome TaxID=412755 RepID=A0A0F9VGK5_9ZZZZ
MQDISTRKIRENILREHGLIPQRQKREKLSTPPYDESEVDFPKTDLMKYIETKYNVLLKLDIYRGSINDVCSRYKWEVDRATISRWRKHIRRYLIRFKEK